MAKASLVIEVVAVMEKGKTYYWIGDRLLGYLDTRREVFVDMWDKKLATIVRLEDQ